MNDISTRSLDPAECAALLAARRYGRIAVTERALPAILPVAYRYHDACVYFPVAANSSLARGAVGHVVAFQIDDASPETGAGWSVLAIGRTDDVTRKAGSDQVVSSVARMWSNAQPTLVLRLDPISVTGRRVERAWPLRD